MGGQRRFPLWRAAAFAVMAAVLSVVVSLPASSSQNPSAIWLATHTAAYRVDTATNRISAALPLPQEAEAVAVDATLGSVWVLAHKRLYRFDAATTSLVAEYDLKRLASKLEDPKRLLLNPYDGSLWVAGEKGLLHLDSLGRPLTEWRASEKIAALAIALDESLWLTTKKELLQLSASGSVLTRVSLTGLHHESRAIAIDSIGGALWLADHKMLLKFNLKDIGQPPVTVYQTKDKTKGKKDEDEDDHGRLTRLAIDSLSGRLWAATKTQILSFDRTGTQLTATELPSDLKETEVLLYDDSSRSLWLGTKKALVRLNDAGDVVARLDIDNELEAAAAAPFKLTPQLSLLSPSDGLLTNNPRPPIRLGLSALCQDAPCAPGENYFSSFSLNATLNGSPVGSLFSLSGTEAAYLPIERLPEGENLFSAQATDAFAHLSNTVRGKFMIDTIPPKFLSVAPADNNVLTTQTVTISGSLDDATATVILENMALVGASVIDANPEHFSFSVPLKAGSNTFNLIARDPAGNSATAVLRLAYNPISVKVTNLTNGAVIDGDRTLVMGTFDGPVNTGVTVNGVVAQTYGKQFYANNVPLVAGENKLSIVATTLGNLSVTESLTISATGRSGIAVERVQNVPIRIRTIAGNGNYGFSGDGGPAMQARLAAPLAIAADRNGNIYITDYVNHRVRKIGTDGIITTIAGNGVYSFSGDNGLATQAGLAYPEGVAVAPDGSIYIADSENFSVRRVTPDGIIRTVAGNGSDSGQFTEGAQATQVSLCYPSDVALGQDGSFYFSDCTQIRRVSTDGIITTYAGTEEWGFAGDGGPAIQAQFTYISGLAFGPDNSLYVVDVYNNRIRKINPNGIVSTIAGNGVNDSAQPIGDGGPATLARLVWPQRVTVGADGVVYVTDSGNQRIRKITPDGTITTIAGAGKYGFNSDDIPPTEALFRSPMGIVLSPDGTRIYFADINNNRVRAFAISNASNYLAPLTTAFKLTNNIGNAIQKIQVDFNGDGNLDLTATNFDVQLEHIYSKPGAYVAKFTVTDSQDNIYTASYAVVAYDGSQLDQLFTSHWNDMNGALTKGDITTASKYLNESAKKKYQPVMHALAPHMAEIVTSFSPMSRISLSENIGEYAVAHDYNGKKHLYLIYFLRDVDGVWRLDSM